MTRAKRLKGAPASSLGNLLRHNYCNREIAPALNATCFLPLRVSGVLATYMFTCSLNKLRGITQILLVQNEPIQEKHSSRNCGGCSIACLTQRVAETLFLSDDSEEGRFFLLLTD